MLVGDFIADVQRKLKRKSEESLIKYAGNLEDWFGVKDGARFFIAGCGLLNYDVILSCNYIYTSYNYIRQGDYTEKELLEEINREMKGEFIS